MNKKFKSLIGKKFGKLTVIKEGKHIKTSTGGIQRRIYICKCDCGNEKSVASSSLTSGRSKTTSCGCEHGFTKKYISKLPNSEASFNAVFKSYVNNAKSRGYVFDLTKDEFRDITQRNCYYCNIPPSNIRTNHLKHRLDHYIYNGIDRLNNDIGYLKNNCVPCCRYCNSLKLNRSIEELKEHIIRLYNNLENI